MAPAELQAGMEKTPVDFVRHAEQELLGTTAQVNHLAGRFGEGNGQLLSFWLMKMFLCPVQT